MSSFKKLSKADITVNPYYANKQWTFTYTSSLPDDNNIIYYKGKNETFDINGTTTAEGQYQSLIYDFINHVFYQKYTSSLNTSSLMFDINTYESASQQRPTSSYFIYNTNPNFINNFPTGVSSEIRVLSINKKIYGSKILPYTFTISSSLFNIKDDGNGNLIDMDSGSNFVGNIFYAHGIATITTPQYLDVLPTTCWIYQLSGTHEAQPTIFQYVTCSGASVTESVGDIIETRLIDSNYGVTIITGSGAYFVLNSPTIISFKNEYIIHENEIKCIIKESEYNLSYNPSLISGSYASGSLKNFATSSNFYPYVTSIGLYNDNNELLMIGKLSKPIMISPHTDMTFKIKYDT